MVGHVRCESFTLYVNLLDNRIKCIGFHNFHGFGGKNLFEKDA